jgi:hypothetical protein
MHLKVTVITINARWVTLLDFTVSPGEHVLVKSTVAHRAFVYGGGRSFDMVGEIKCLQGSRVGEIKCLRGSMCW